MASGQISFTPLSVAERMIIMGFWSNLWFDVCDFFTTSDVEGQRNQYKKLVQYLEKNIPQLRSAVSDIEGNGMSILFPAISGQNDQSSSGGVVIKYGEKYDIIETDVKAMFEEMKSYLASMEAKLPVAQAELARFEELVRIENERKAELARQEQERLLSDMK